MTTGNFVARPMGAFATRETTSGEAVPISFANRRSDCLVHETALVSWAMRPHNDGLPFTGVGSVGKPINQAGETMKTRLSIAEFWLFWRPRVLQRRKPTSTSGSLFRLPVRRRRWAFPRRTR
jgi:hypothetical protein